MESDFELVGHIGVDAGLCWIGDPCYILHTKKLPESLGKNWLDFCKLLSGKYVKSFGYDLGHEGLGVVTSTGHGDGFYPVYARKEGDRVAEIRVVFIGGNADSEEEFEDEEELDEEED